MAVFFAARRLGRVRVGTVMHDDGVCCLSSCTVNPLNLVNRRLHILMIPGLVPYDDDSFSESESLPEQNTIVRSHRRPSIPQLLSILRRVGKQSEERAKAISRMYVPLFFSFYNQVINSLPSSSNSEVPSHYKTPYHNPPQSPRSAWKSSLSRGKT